MKNWCRDNDFLFGALIETRVAESKANDIVSEVFPGWSFMNNFDHHRLGRIWVLWRDIVRVTPVFKSSQLVSVLVKVQEIEEEFLCMFVYGSNFVEERKILREDIRSHISSPIYRRKRWMIMGDFNEILSRADYSCIGTPSLNGMEDFQSVIYDPKITIFMRLLKVC